jgi:hypothetical protein
MNEVIETETAKRKVGHPPKRTPQTITRILKAIENGCSIKQACTIGGVTAHAFLDWRKSDPEIEARLVEAREVCREKALENIKTAGDKGDWRASESFLRLSYPASYNRGFHNNTSVEVNTSTTVQAVVVNEEKRRQLVQKHRMLFGGEEAPELPGAHKALEERSDVKDNDRTRAARVVEAQLMEEGGSPFHALAGQNETAKPELQPEHQQSEPEPTALQQAMAAPQSEWAKLLQAQEARESAEEDQYGWDEGWSDSALR